MSLLSLERDARDSIALLRAITRACEVELARTAGAPIVDPVERKLAVKIENLRAAAKNSYTDLEDELGRLEPHLTQERAALGAVPLTATPQGASCTGTLTHLDLADSE